MFTGQKYNVEVFNKDIVIWKICSISNKRYEVSINQHDWYDYMHGKLVQNAFPHLNEEQREFIMSGITPHEWNEMFSDDENRPWGNF